MQLKYCHQCEKNLPLKLFNKNKNTKDGHASPCKYCISVKRKIHSPSISDKLDARILESKEKIRAKPLFTLDCDYGDYTQTKLHNNFFFISGDGGYKKYLHEQISKNAR